MLETLQLHLTTSATSYRPGDTVLALLQASSGSGSVELQEVELQFAGIERVDTSWVSAAYRRDVPPINADKRHLQRYVVQSRLQAATQGTLGGAKDRKFVVRFTLPATLPPSFRGTAVRVSYQLIASVHFRLLHGGGIGTAPSSPDASVASFGPSEAATEQQLQDTLSPDGITTSTVQLPIHIWPLKPEGEGITPSSPAAAAGASADSMAVVTSEDMPIKCWEIGPGTGVQEAIAHICRLVSQPSGTSASTGTGQRSEGGEASDPPGSSSNSEGGGDLAPAASAQQPAASRPIARQATADSERGLITPAQSAQFVDPSTVLRSYALRIGEHAIARVSLHPPVEGALYPGATLAGTLELIHPELQAAGGSSGGGGSRQRQGSGTGAKEGEGQEEEEEDQGPPPGVPRCMQVLILLETEERLAAQWRPAGKGGSDSGTGGGAVIRRVYEEQLDITADVTSTHFVFTVPPGSQANFQTPLLALQWVLRFQFTASTPKPGGSANPLQGKIDQLTWALPLHVGAPQ